MIPLTLTEKKRFEDWVIANVDETLVPADEGNGEALMFNLIHAIRGDRDLYDYRPEQDIEINSWIDNEF